jgi:hypothetical protein
MAKYKYSYHEERGEFSAYVEDEKGNVVWEVRYPDYYEDDETGELVESNTIFDDGYMKHHNDIDGLEKYLKSIGVLKENDELVDNDDFADGGEVSQRWRENKIYAVPIDSEIEVKGERIPYFYLHGQAQDINGYDICNGNIHAIVNCLEQGAFLCEIEFTNGSVQDAICFCKYSRDSHMTGWIVLLSDFESIIQAVKVYKYDMFPSMYSDEKEYLKSIGVYDTIKSSLSYADGGSVEQGNIDMVKNQVIQVEHHAKELMETLKSNPQVDAWVVAKMDRATSNLSDITHYLEGEQNSFADGGMMASGGTLENKLKKKLTESFELPMEMAVYVPSTDKANIIISKRDYASRIEEVERYLSDLFGGYSAVSVDGGYVSDDKGLIQEDVTRVATFGSTENFESKFTKLINKVVDWCNKWGQESMGFEFEGDMFYIDKKASFKHGGQVYTK